MICCIYLSTNRGYKANSRLFTIERLPGISAGEGTEDFPPRTPLKALKPLLPCLSRLLYGRKDKHTNSSYHNKYTFWACYIH
ncbi:hypothetical protein HMPREF0742_00645 [Rothia aeria F0184]|uniref:Uncharacterized protein n=1 Tax=Rothia aeria F0184 TaxID=888019 RepID=U7V663_9MICC|nr:hypothetical protein HMPREF0742_00645 [Rothia aeria F0184]